MYLQITTQTSIGLNYYFFNFRIMRLFLIIHTIMELSVGLTILIFPSLLSDLNQALLTESEGLQFARLFGVSLICVGVLSWKIRNLTEPASVLPALTALGVYQGLVAAVLVYGQLMGIRSEIAWMFPLGHGALAVGFAYFVRKRTPH